MESTEQKKLNKKFIALITIIFLAIGFAFGDVNSIPNEEKNPNAPVYYDSIGPAGIEGQNPPVYSDTADIIGSSSPQKIKFDTSSIEEELYYTSMRLTVFQREHLYFGIILIGLLFGVFWLLFDIRKKTRLILQNGCREPSGITKRTYRTQDEAERAATELTKQVKNLKAYKCKDCGLWHLTVNAGDLISIQKDEFQISLGYNLMCMVDKEDGAELLKAIANKREELKKKEIPLSRVRIMDDMNLKQNEFTIRRYGAVVAGPKQAESISDILTEFDKIIKESKVRK